MRPFAASSHTLARPISTPPARADSGVKLSKVIFRQLFDPQSSTYTYLLADEASRQALLIDPVFEQARRDAALVEELGVKLAWTLETHVHADHVTGAWLLKDRLGSRIACPGEGRGGWRGPPASGRRKISFGKRHLEARATPGHTGGCLTYVLDDQSMAFTGDALLIRGCGRTDFQEGNPRTLFRSVRERIFSLPDGCLVYPGARLPRPERDQRRRGEALQPAPRRGDRRGRLRRLHEAPRPRASQADGEAVPANLKCGRRTKPSPPTRTGRRSPTPSPASGRCSRTGSRSTGGEVQIVDVREPDEFNGPSGTWKALASSRWGPSRIR